MKRSGIPAAAFVLIAGTLLHFTYGWFGDGVAWFSAVNESTWEHLKLLFFPVFIAAAVEFAVYGRQMCGFWLWTLLGVLAGMVFIVIFFYTYTGILGYNLAPLDVSAFFGGVAVTYLVRRWLYGRRVPCSPVYNAVGIAGMAVLAALFIRFTYAPPQLALFCDPVTGTFGAFQQPPV